MKLITPYGALSGLILQENDNGISSLWDSNYVHWQQRRNEMIKLICSDIDGTLLDSNRQLSERTIAAIRKVKEAVPFVLISSRMPKAMTHLQAEADISRHPLIAYNGGLVLDYTSGKAMELLSIEIEIAIAEAIIRFVSEFSIHVSLYHNDEWYVPDMDYWAEREQRNTKVTPQVKDLTEVCTTWKAESKGAHKIMCMGEVGEIQLLENYLRLHHSDSLNVYRSKDTYIEIASKKISKLSGLAHLLKEVYDIHLDDVMAFGDNFNDEEMIGGVGHGVAVDNARDVVKNVATEVTLGHKEDGVAIVLERIADQLSS